MRRALAIGLLLVQVGCGGTSSTSPTSSSTAAQTPSAVQPPVKLIDVKPAYPAEAQSARVQGVVILEATVGTDGHVSDVRVVRSIPLLDQAAVDAVKQWVFSPALLNGQPVVFTLTVTVNFTLI